jgi:hypothetical protein
LRTRRARCWSSCRRERRQTEEAGRTRREEEVVATVVIEIGDGVVREHDRADEADRARGIDGGEDETGVVGARDAGGAEEVAAEHEDLTTIVVVAMRGDDDLAMPSPSRSSSEACAPNSVVRLVVM